MKNSLDELNMVISGIGGQGSVLSARILGAALVNKGYYAGVMDTFGGAQRGGSVNSTIRISKSKFIESLIPAGAANIIVSLEPLETLRMLKTHGSPDVLTLTSFCPVLSTEALTGDEEYPDFDQLKKTIIDLSKKSWFLDANKISRKINAPRSGNIVMLGALARTGILPIYKEDIEKAICDYFQGNKVKPNIAAFEQGFGAI